MQYAVPLIGEARARQQRRRRSGALIALSVALVIAGAYLAEPHGSGPALIEGFRVPAGTAVVSPSEAFSEDPYMGVRCPVANSIACDRVGLAIWLRRPAYSVIATIAGRPLAMNRFGDQFTGSGRPRTEFDGYLRPAGIVTRMHVSPIPGTHMWDGVGTPLVSVWLLINYGSGRHAVTHLGVPLSAGWG